MKKYYRYKELITGYYDEDYPLSEYYSVSIKLVEYDEIKQTPKGCWIGRYGIKEHWISNTSRKKYAYPTKEDALKSFKIRKRNQLQILERQLTQTKRVLNLLESEEYQTNEQLP